MRPTRFQNDEHAKREINGLRPSPLKINKESQVIHKPSSSSSSYIPEKLQQRQPVIIYTHSPKIIHTQARDFMALVQKLTGLSRSEKVIPNPSSSVDNESSSVVTEDNCCNGGWGAPMSSSSASPIFRATNQCLADIPLFTPNSARFFFSPQSFYRYSETAFATSNVGNSESSEYVDMKWISSLVCVYVCLLIFLLWFRVHFIFSYYF